MFRCLHSAKVCAALSFSMDMPVTTRAPKRCAEAVWFCESLWILKYQARCDLGVRVIQSCRVYSLYCALCCSMFPCCHAADLQADNTRLRQELLELRLALEAADTGKGTAAARAAAAAVAGGSSRDGEEEEEEEDALAAAERLLGGSSDTTGAAAVVSPDWKVQEIGRLQGENRQLQAKVGI